MDLRRYTFDLSATITKPGGSKSEVIRSNPTEFTSIKAVFGEPDKNGWRSLPDPSDFLSFETVVKPRRHQYRHQRPTRNVGVGNVRMYNPELFYAVLLVEAKLKEELWSKDLGSARFQHSITLRLHMATFQISYGETPTEHTCTWQMAPYVEEDNVLLKVFSYVLTLQIFHYLWFTVSQTWPKEDYKYEWEAPKKLDTLHKMWYEMDCAGHLLLLNHWTNAIEHPVAVVLHIFLLYY